MTALVRITASEWRKLRAIPTVWWLLAATVMVTAGATVLAFVVVDLNDMPANTGRGLKEGMHAIGVGTTLAQVAGIIGMAGEFRFRQADQTFLSEPRRGRVVAAKAIVLGLLGIAFGVASASSALATAWIWLTVKGPGLPLEQALLWKILGGAVVSALFFAVLGVAVGAALRNQVAAIVLVLALQTVVESAIFAASSSVGRFLPSQAGDALRQFPAEGLLSVGTAAVVLAGWVAVLLAAGVIRTRRGDIT
jgi:ABC-2 type transport system permease protein